MATSPKVTPLSTLDFVSKGDPILARDINALTRNAKKQYSSTEYNLSNRTISRPHRREQSVVSIWSDNESFAPYQIGEVYDYFTTFPDPMYQIREYVADNTPEVAFVVVDGNGMLPVAAGFRGRGQLILPGKGFRVKVDTGDLPVIGVGRYVGPKHGEKDFFLSHCGYQVFGMDDRDTWWVSPTHEPCLGQGKVYAGQAVDADPIRLDTVTFSSGLSCWDGTTAFYVENVFSDPIDDGLHCQFKWDCALQKFVVTDIECI